VRRLSRDNGDLAPAILNSDSVDAALSPGATSSSDVALGLPWPPLTRPRRYQASLGIAEEAADLAVGYLDKTKSKL
jgi:hypothetical protein